MAYYIGGFTWEGKSQLQRFLSDNLWENGYGEDKYQHLFDNIQIGDYFALKSTFVKDNKSWLKIGGIGTVKEKINSSTLKIDWLDISENKLTDIRWYANTLEKIDDKNHIERIFGKAIKKGAMNEITQILYAKKQIIFQGAPGTGKTYIAKDIAEQLIFDDVTPDKKAQAERLRTSEQFKLVQFHPSYTYEDFVRGIVVKTETGSVAYDTIDKILGSFANTALENCQDSLKDPIVVSKESAYQKVLELFIEKIRENVLENGSYNLQGTTANIIEVTEKSFKYSFDSRPSIIYNLLFSDMKKIGSNRLDIKRATDIKSLDDILVMKGKYPYYYRVFQDIEDFVSREKINLDGKAERVKLKNYVLIIDEINRANLPAVLGELIYALEYRGEKVESMYAADGENGLVLPSNLYIIGTMNTADRSVGQIDYAIRRRFAFIDMLPKVLTDEKGFDIDLFKKVSSFFIENVEEYFNVPETTILKKSEWLSDEFSPEDVWIGHSYFIMNNNRDIRLKYEIKPILKEYLKDGVLKDSVNGQDTKTAINAL